MLNLFMRVCVRVIFYNHLTDNIAWCITNCINWVFKKTFW